MLEKFRRLNLLPVCSEFIKVLYNELASHPPVGRLHILASLNSTYLGPGSETYTISPSGSGLSLFQGPAATTIFAIATPGAMLCCRAETLQGTIGLSCRATLWSDFNAKGTRGLLGLEGEFLVHVTSPKGWTAALLEFNQVLFQFWSSCTGSHG